MFVPLPLTPWAGGHFAEAVLQKTIFGFCIPSNEEKWFPSFRNNQVLTHSTRTWGSWVQLYFTVGASPTLRPKVNPGCVGGSFRGGRAGNQESHSEFFLLQLLHSIWIKILWIQQHGSSSSWFRHSAVVEEKQEDAGLPTIYSEH